MSKTFLKLPVMFFAIPFVYLSLLLDTYFHSMFGFLFTLLFSLAVGFYFKACDHLILWLLGNILSTVISVILQAQHPEWHFFYQPFNPAFLVLFLSLLYLIPQVIGIIWATSLQIHLSK
ncbi:MULTISPECIES: hypothetical protein [Enterococcus]|jgi:hypothetical protein|uniref:Integral membrane protein n=1 Tax=Enterococcus dispar ATCC 51266 TaxID=1139219 RepID=S1NZK7_9ENTE|nr:hypothetical protein [Enterococcus dispar]EOT43742.1 hypothetical protein OMK_00300 [Enterococcus dispar ATCC 51266]EOW85586.1 hypothetical protein I569_00899 [Enterococcus dispar ATCC 51266]MCU7358154.1 hypothetical protein [Enterococcus dispar]MDT2705671.1 hypothetical protein [Enterococcus dispar]WCG32906.1 hypothetical protein PML78_12025 [Enterococcus dispar]